MRYRLDARRTDGFILPVFLITTVLIAIIITTIMTTATLDYRLSTREYHKVNAQMAADAGFDNALVALTANTAWTGVGETTLLDNGTTKTTYQTTVSAGASANKKVISVTAKTYSPKVSPAPQITRKYEIDVEAVTSGAGPSSVVSGVGGLILNNNAKISGGDVVVNGKVTVNNNAQIGLSSNPVNVRVAHQSCPVPPNATYPRVCASGENGQPITMGGTAYIYGNVQATNQTNGTNMLNPGLVAGATFDPIPMPTYDRDAHKAAVAVNKTAAQASCSGGATTWENNLKISGNVSVSNNCSITVQGNVWITGNLTLGNNAKLIIANSMGSTRPVIMVDGSSGFSFGNNSQIMPNGSGTGAEIITFWSAGACGADCPTVTGSDLANSQGVLTIDLSNNGSAQNSVMWSYWSKTRIANNGALGAVSGQTVELSQNAVISFTASVPGSNNLITAWVKRGYMRTFN